MVVSFRAVTAREQTQTYPNSTSSSEFLLQASLKLAGVRLLVRIDSLHHPAQAEHGSNENGGLEETLRRRDPGVLVRAEQAQCIVVLVHRLAVVPPLLLIPPVGVRVAELSLDLGRVDVAAVLRDIVSPGPSNCAIKRGTPRHLPFQGLQHLSMWARRGIAPPVGP